MLGKQPGRRRRSFGKTPAPAGNIQAVGPDRRVRQIPQDTRLLRRRSAVNPVADSRGVRRYSRLVSALAIFVVAFSGVLAGPMSPATAESNPIGLQIRATNTFNLYAEAGETVDINFTLRGRYANANDAIVTIERPGSAPLTCSLLTVTAPMGTACDWNDLAVTQSGIWAVTYASTGSGGTASIVDWDISVKDAGTPVPGRVWIERYNATSAAGTSTFSLWYQSELGDQYKATYSQYNGADSVFRADATGIRNPGTCDAVYESGQMATGPFADPYTQAGVNECGDAYKIFFDAPDAGLPASATKWDGSTDWILPPVIDPTLGLGTFTPANNIDQSGSLEFTATNFSGNMNILLDANNDGDFDDPVDRRIPYFGTNGANTFAFDGLNGLGDLIPATQPISFQAIADRTGEIHFINTDVEVRTGGIEVVAQRGPAAGDATLYWNDVPLAGEGTRCSSTAVLDGTGGIDSTGGVHAWSDCVGLPSNTNDGIGGSWGDTRYINDWTYRQINALVNVPVSSRELDFGDAIAGYGTLLADDGARHLISGYDSAAKTAPVMMGASIDNEMDGQPGITADGDGLDEDGVAAPMVITQNQPSTVTVSVTNDSNADVTLSGWIDLNGDGVFQSSERTVAVVPANSGTANYQLTFPAGTTSTNTYARFRVFGAVVTDPQPTGIADGGEVEDYLVSVLDPALLVAKTSDATADTRPGDTIAYTVTVTNSGTGDYTAGFPASMSDDLSGVLDDAAFDNNAAVTFSAGSSSAQPVLTGTNLEWSGPLKAGESAIITYSVKLNAGGDGIVSNSACVPAAEAVGQPCVITETKIPRLTVSKSADTTEIPANGGVVKYTVTVANPGPGDFTATAPGSASDDLSDVLDDADYGNNAVATAGTVSFDAAGQKLNWSGPLAAGTSATITYEVIYQADKGGDKRLLNTVCVPVALAADPANACGRVDIPGAGLEENKTVNPASGTAVSAGQSLTYTLTFNSTGPAAATVDTTDDLSDVLDDATVTSGPTASDPALTTGPIQPDGTFSITGSVPSGQTYTVTYTVLVKAFPDQGNHILANVLNCDASNPGCTPPVTENRIKHLSVTKTSDAAQSVNTGSTVKYTVTVTNDGQAEYTANEPASATDDLTGVLDDARFNNDAATTSGQLSYTAPILGWTGALGVGQSATISYTMTVTNAGDHALINTAQAICSPSTDCPAVTVTTPLPHIVTDKSSDPVTGTDVSAGQVVTYTLSFTNDGQAAGPVDSTDSLADVLDDAAVTSEPVASDPAVTVIRAGNQIRTTGQIQPGQVVTITYQITVNPDGERGNNIVRNVLTPDAPICLVAADCPVPVTEHRIGELDDWKTVDPASGTTVQPGKTVTYTLHFQNTGTADVAVTKDDVLAQILDDATITTVPVSSDPALTVTSVNEGRFTISGSLAPEQLVTVTYTVTVNPDGQRGDDRLGNFLVGQGLEPPAACVPADTERPDCTVNFVSNIVVHKSADPESGTNVAPGQEVTYTLTFANTSTNPDAADGVVAYTDHMRDVLDDATLASGPTSNTAGVAATITGDTIVVSGALPTGATATVTYSVKVNTYEQGNNHVLGNVVAITGERPICAPDSQLCTNHPIDPPTMPITLTPPAANLANTGTSAVGWVALLGTVLIAAGGGGIALVRRRKANETKQGAIL